LYNAEDDERDSDMKNDLNKKTCLQCNNEYKMDTNSTVTKYISYKCNHHFCLTCILDWRVGWKDNENTKTRRNESDENIATLKCPYSTCAMQHDRIGGTDSQGIRQSFEPDIITMSQLRKDYISKIDNKKKSMKIRIKERHNQSLTCG
jgi:hypothetical protein